MRLAETRWGSGRSKQLNPVVMGPGSRFACPARQLSLTIEFSNSRRHSRDMVCPSSAISLSLSVRKGRRESRALTAPAAPCAMRKENAHGLDRYSRDIPAFPAQWFYGFLRALPGERRFLSPLPRQHGPAWIDATVAAPGPHDFAVRCRRFVWRYSRLTPQRPSHPGPT